MQAVSKKAVTVVLAAVFVFMMAFPVPINGLLLEKQRYEQARANPAIAAPVVLGTFLTVCGCYVACDSLNGYETNLDSLYQGISSGTQYYSNAWSTYVQEKGSFDAALLSAVTIDGQSIDLQVLSDAGLFDTVQNYSAYMVNNGIATTGTSSLAGGTTINIGGFEYNTIASMPPGYQEKIASRNVVELSNAKIIGYYIDSSTVYVAYGTSYSVNVSNQNTSNGTFSWTPEYMVLCRWNGSAITDWQARRNNYYTFYANPSNTYFNANMVFYKSGVAQNDGVNWNDVKATIAETLANGTAVAPTSTVQPFEPTQEQISVGYSSADIVEAINSGNQSTTGIAEDVAALLPAVQGLAGLLSPLAGIAANVAGIDTNVTSILSNVAGLATAPFTWLAEWWATLTGWWNALLTWLGDTPFGNVMGTVISGVQALPGAIDGAATDVLGEIAAIPGALEGWLEGILDGVLSIPGSIAGVIEGIQQAVSDMAGAIEGIFEPFIHPTMPVDSGGTVSIALPPGLFEAEKFDLSDKVPFCYLIRTQGALTSMFSNFATYRSFYFDLDVPFAGNVRFDGEPVLSQSFGAFDIADTIKGLATGLLCLGLLYRAYKVFERQMGGA